MHKKISDTIQEITIEAGHSERNYWQDIWRYRELFYILAWRDIKVRYKQTSLGIAWAVIRPLLTMIIFTVIFSKVAGLSSEGNVPYAIMVYAAMLPWQFFSNALQESSSSLLGNANLISKVYFPRMIVPASSVVVSLVDFIISFVIMFFLFLWYQYIPDWRFIFLPFFLLLAFFIAYGSGLLLAALNVKYRDFRHIIPFIIQIGLYISPVGFSSSVVPEKWRLFYALNPMVIVIDGFRWCMLRGQTVLNIYEIILSLVIISIIFIIAATYFRKMEKGFADVI